MRSLRLCSLLLSTALALAAQDVKEFEKRVTEFTLANGLRFLLLERHDAPTVSFHTYVRAGSADDGTGRTGMTYLFEHTSFSGSETIGSRNWTEERKALDSVETLYDQLEGERNLGPRAQQSRIDTLRTQLRIAIDTAHRYALPTSYAAAIEEGGSTRLTVVTTHDSSEASYSLPSNRIELWFLMESQRLMHPVFRGFYTDRDNAAEERQKRMEGTAQGRLFTAFTAAAFQAHPYRNPPMGWPGDLANLRRTDALAFFQKYYVPGNIVMTLVGDVAPAEAKKLAEKYFGAWTSRPLPPLVHTQDPPAYGPKTAVVETPGQPLLLVGYRRPSQFHKDDAGFDILQFALTQGRTGLLYKELITDKHVAQSVQASATFPSGRYPNIFLFALVPAQGHTVDETQKALDEFLNRLKLQRLDPATIARAKAQVRALLINRLSNNAGMASLLAVYQGSYGDWHKIFVALDDLNKVAAEDLQRMLVQYFVPAMRTTAYTVLPGQSGATPVPKPQAPTGDKQ